MNWISVRFLMIVAQVLDLDTQAIDFVLAFPQAELEVPVYMELPAGMDIAGHGKDSSILHISTRMTIHELDQCSFSYDCCTSTRS